MKRCAYCNRKILRDRFCSKECSVSYIRQKANDKYKINKFNQTNDRIKDYNLKIDKLKEELTDMILYIRNRRKELKHIRR
jgi:hypothetical protein